MVKGEKNVDLGLTALQDLTVLCSRLVTGFDVIYRGRGKIRDETRIPAEEGSHVLGRVKGAL